MLARGSPSSRQEFVAAIVRPEIDDSIRAWAALRPAPVESRFDALHATGLTELVGREEELELLLRRWLKAKTGEGQVVLLSGEAGIGKSHLTAALLERLAGEPHTRLRYFCSPQHTDSALYPIISQWSGLRGSRTTITRKRSSISSMRCWRRASRPAGAPLPDTHTPTRAREKSLNFFAFEQQQMGNWPINCCDDLGLPINAKKFLNRSV